MQGKSIVDWAVLELHRQEQREKKRVRRAKFIWHKYMLRRLMELHEQGLSVEEIAQTLKIWPETVQNKLRELEAGQGDA